VIVVDASVLLTALVDDGKGGGRARAELTGESLSAPEVIDLELLSALRGLVSSEKLSRRRADLALQDLAALPVRRVGHGPLLERCWELRQNLTPYDAAYVALAERLKVRLVTADRGIAAAPRLRCEVVLLR
jgi:predicted nucleic acid-binding protein